MNIDLREHWSLGGVEIPGRLVLAPMAGVSVQAFRRQGRRFGAGLVCSEMVSVAGIQHRNERTLGYLRVAADEHPLAIQIFGSDPAAMAEAARMVEAAGADIVDMNFGCPVKKVTKTGAGASLLDDPEHACRLVDAVASATPLPVSVKMRRGVENGSRTCLDGGAAARRGGRASLTLHPRSAKQMYTGTADHSLTAELVELVDVPVIASGDITSRARAQAVLATTGATAVMVGVRRRATRGCCAEIMGDDREPSREEVVAELLLFMRERARARRAARLRLPEKVLRLVLGRGRFPRPFKQELVLLPTLAEVEPLLLAAAPGARFVLERLTPSRRSDGRGAARLVADLALRRRLIGRRCPRRRRPDRCWTHRPHVLGTVSSMSAPPAILALLAAVVVSACRNAWQRLPSPFASCQMAAKVACGPVPPGLAARPRGPARQRRLAGRRPRSRSRVDRSTAARDDGRPRTLAARLLAGPSRPSARGSSSGRRPSWSAWPSARIVGGPAAGVDNAPGSASAAAAALVIATLCAALLLFANRAGPSAASGPARDDRRTPLGLSTTLMKSVAREPPHGRRRRS